MNLRLLPLLPHLLTRMAGDPSPFPQPPDHSTQDGKKERGHRSRGLPRSRLPFGILTEPPKPKSFSLVEKSGIAREISRPGISTHSKSVTGFDRDVPTDIPASGFTNGRSNAISYSSGQPRTEKGEAGVPDCGFEGGREGGKAFRLCGVKSNKLLNR